MLGIEGYSGVLGEFCPNIWILKGTKGCRNVNYGCVVATPGFKPARGTIPLAGTDLSSFSSDAGGGEGG